MFLFLYYPFNEVSNCSISTVMEGNKIRNLFYPLNRIGRAANYSAGLFHRDHTGKIVDIISDIRNLRQIICNAIKLFNFILDSLVYLLYSKLSAAFFYDFRRSTCNNYRNNATWNLSSTVFITQLYPAISAFIRLISLHLIIQTGSLNKISRAFPYIAPSFLNTPTAVLQRILISPLTLHSPIY